MVRLIGSVIIKRARLLIPVKLPRETNNREEEEEGEFKVTLVHKKKEDLKKGILLHLYPKGKSALFPQVVMLLYITDVTTK